MKLSNEQFEQFKEQLNSIETPTNQIAFARQEAYQSFMKKKKRHRMFTIQISIAAVIILAFLTSIRLSPTFAQTIAKIPGFAPIVELIAENKGVEDIINNEYYEEINKSVSKNGIDFTLVGTIADEYGMVLLYTVEAPKIIDELRPENIIIKQNGKELENGSTVTYGWYEEDNKKLVEDKIEYVSVEKIDYSNPNFELNFDIQNESFTVPFTLSKPILQSKIIDVNKEISIDDQKIYIEEMNISPLRVGLTFKKDPNNSMEILRMNNLKLLDEKKEEWGTIQNGLVAFGDFRDEGSVTYFFQSNYFRNPKELTLILEDIEALPKGKDYIEIDFSNKQISKSDLFNDLDITIENNHSIVLKYKKEDNYSYTSLLSKAVDQKGTVFYPNSSSSTGIDGIAVQTYTYDFENAKQPIKFYFSSYPNYLNEKVKINIPVK